MNHAFLITSAINTKFGVFDGEDRLRQTLETISSIKFHLPTAKIYLIEMSAIVLNSHQRGILQNHSNLLIEYSNDENVKEIFESDNWDVVKNVTEVACFQNALSILHNGDYLSRVDRAHKISGRYTLNDKFKPEIYETSERVVVSRKRTSQFAPEITGISFQYMSRLWSWPVKITPTIIDLYTDGLAYMLSRINSGGYCDIEHMLYRGLQKVDVSEVDTIGVQGRLGPNGIEVAD
jgi:hypothetical protein